MEAEVVPFAPRAASAEEVRRAAAESLAEGQRVVLATVVARRGSAPSTPGQKIVLLAAENAVGSVGGGAIEWRVLQTMLALRSGANTAPKLESYELGPTMGMCCGGGVDVLIEVLDPALLVVVLGAGHIGAAVTPMLAGLGFRVILCDSRDELVEARQREFNAAIALLHAEPDDPELSAAVGEGAAQAALLVMTHDHQRDQEAIEWGLKQGFGFVGGVGSRAKAARTRARLEAKGFAEDLIKAVQMPLGTDIEARLPAEIAVSIAGELIRWRALLLATRRRQRGRAKTEAMGANRRAAHPACAETRAADPRLADTRDETGKAR